jgi:hypothetical protein
VKPGDLVHDMRQHEVAMQSMGSTVRALAAGRLRFIGRFLLQAPGPSDHRLLVSASEHDPGSREFTI